MILQDFVHNQETFNANISNSYDITNSMVNNYILCY